MAFFQSRKIVMARIQKTQKKIKIKVPESAHLYFIIIVNDSSKFVDFVHITPRWGKMQQNIGAHKCIKFRN